MLTYPHIDPILLAIGPIKIRWYGMMYVIGFIAAWFLAMVRAKKPNSGWTAEQVSDLIFYSAIGVVVGGRLGYMLFYNWPILITDPVSLLRIWYGGMAFHGGLIGVLIAFGYFAKKTQKTFFTVADFLTPMVPIGLGLGRIGNFINGELWGRITTVPWGMVFPNAGPFPRHPSQLYEFFLEGVVLFTILWWYSSKPRAPMAVSGLFLVLYGCFRIFCELFRQPDVQIGFLAFDWLTEGQLLSVPMIIAGAIMLILSRRHAKQLV
jgi:phosphatidylglycerol---prolipoprotein diacylglyceryl transferase